MERLNIILFLFFGVILYFVCAKNLLSYELQALQDLYDSTSGKNWTYPSATSVVWDFNQPDPNPCKDEWAGLICISDNDKPNAQNIYTIDLVGYNLSGTLPASIGNFSELGALYLSNNFLFDGLPDTVGRLTRLVNISGENGYFSGFIPKSLWSIGSLNSVKLSNNYFNGIIPSDIGSYRGNYLDLSLNLLVGSLPVEIGDCENLLWLLLYENLLTGSLPNSIGKLTKLKHLELEGNKLNGSIPEEFYFLSDVSYVDINHNLLTGNLSTSIGNLHNIEVLDLSINSLTGSLPNEITSLTKLTTLLLNSNSFIGSIPKFIGQLSSLSYLLLDDNEIDGSLPDSIYDLSNLVTLSVVNCHLTGPISEDISKLENLQQLTLSNNYFNGTLPSFNGIHALTISLDNNEFTGSLPGSIASISNLLSLYMNGNLLDGDIPEEFCFFKLLTIMYLNDNDLTGTIPDCLSSNRELIDINLEANHLHGTIPHSFYNFSQGLYLGLNLGNNLLSGTISDGLSMLSTKIELISLGNNILSGTIPSVLSKFSRLIYLKLEYNQFTGTMPPLLTQIHLETCFINNNKFHGKAADIVVYVSNAMRLINLDISNNQFTGPIPSIPFMIKTFQTFAAVSNCLTGSLPSEICGATNLVTLAMDGMRSASSCQHRFFPEKTGVRSYWLSENIQGDLHSCLFELPKLSILHLSGNGFDGTLPKVSIISEVLDDLTISNNNLGGSIPKEIQSVKTFSNFDASFNKFGGLLISEFPVYDNDASVSLQVNRLSGNIPISLRMMQNIHLLDGNMFYCGTNRVQLPINDPDYNDYECGSNTFNYSMYAWIIVLFILITCAVVVSSLQVPTHKNWMSPFKTTTVDNNITQLGAFLNQYRFVCGSITLFVAIVALPVNAILSLFFDTYEVEYAWMISSAFLSGVTPSITMLFVIVLFIGLLVTVSSSQTRHALWTLEHAVSVEYTFRQWSIVLAVVFFDIILMIGINVAYVIIHNSYDSFIVQISQVSVAFFKTYWNRFITRWVLTMHRNFTKSNEGRWSLTLHGIDDKDEDTTRDSESSQIVHTQSIALGVVIMLFNNLAAPFIATAFVSNNCFYDVLANPPDITVSYLYTSCAQYVGVDCVQYEYGTDLRTTTFIPPFNYRYWCTSTVIITYSSVYVFMLIIMGFIAPFTKIVMSWNARNLPPTNIVHIISIRFLPKLLRPYAERKAKSWNAESALMAMFDIDFTSKRLFHCEVFVVKLVNMLTVLVTFGVIVPPLAIVCLIAIYSVTYFNQWCIGRYIVSLKAQLADSKSEEYLHIISSLDADCAGAAVMLRKSLWLLVPFLVLFYSFFLFDILGDELGWKKAIWMPVVMIGLPIVLWLMRKYTIFGKMYHKDSRGSWGSLEATEMAENPLLEPSDRI